MPATAAPPSAHPSTSAASFLVGTLKPTLWYAELLVKDIPADKFAHMPHPTMNHPAFNIGHLSLYPNRLFTIIGQPEKVVEKTGYKELFAAGVPCVEQDGRYPHKDELVSCFMDRYRAASEAIAKLPDDVLRSENPMEGRLKEMLPQLGMAVNFLLNNHIMAHLGQISAWRRALGLPSVM
jgi:hypothetical protein